MNTTKHGLKHDHIVLHSTPNTRTRLLCDIRPGLLLSAQHAMHAGLQPLPHPAVSGPNSLHMPCNALVNPSPHRQLSDTYVARCTRGYLYELC